MIGPIKEGLRKDLKPFATPEDSFDFLNNAIQFRGRIIRKPGYTKLGRLADGNPVMGLRTYENFGINLQTLVAFSTTTAYEWNGTTFINLPSVMPVTWSGTNSQFFWTINYANAFWATNSKPGLNGFAVTNFTNQITIAGDNFVDVTAPGNTFQVNDAIYFINVTGGGSPNNLRQGIVTVAGNPFTIKATDGLGAFTNGAAITGMALSTTRAVTGQDGIRYYGILTNGTGWANYNPPVDPNNALAGALLIFAYRGYLVFLNTAEGNDAGINTFPNRARWTQIGTPYYSTPVPVVPNPQGIVPETARDDLFGRGGASDAPTNEAIVAASFIRDILVVYFERSTWRLRFVNNAQNPFVWERVNIELGSECTFSAIPFDKGLMAIGNRGIVISDGNDTIRIDEKIPDEAFNIRVANNGLQRVNGIRTFRTKLVFWTYPSSDNPTGTFPDKVLVFNHDTKNWSYFDDGFTCFGYFYPSNTGLTWNDLPDAWASYNNVSWNSGISQVDQEIIVAGNQQGYVLQISEPTEDGDFCINEPSLSITAIANTSPATFTSINNNLASGSWITLSGVTGTTSDDGVSLNGRNFKLANPTLAANDFTLTEFQPINGGSASGTSYTYTVNYKGILQGSCQINIGALVFLDPNADGVLVESAGLGSGTISYTTGAISLTFNPAIGSTTVYIRVVSLDPLQGIVPVFTTGVYGGGGEIAKISGYDIQTKIFNFFGDDKRSRLSKIDFYTDITSKGQFTCNILADSSNEVINTPLPDNLFSNIVLTAANPYQIGQGDQAIFRLYCDAIAQTVQLQLTLSDAQMAVNSINKEDFQLLAMMFTMRRGGRLV